jgi:hypothetical protein
MQHIQSSPVMKRNPRPRKYASDAERQAAFRARNVMVEFRAENKTADTLNKISDEIDVSRSDLVLSMVKFALTNHDWARFGLTHKTIPLYKGNPMATKKPSPAQLAARQKFADMVRARAAAAKGKKMPRKNPRVSHAINNLRTVKQMRNWFESAPFKTDGLTDGQVKALKNELIVLGYGDYTAGLLPPKVFYNALNFATGRKTNPMESALLHLSGTKYGQVKQQGHIFTAYVLQKVNTGIGEEMDLLDSKSFKTKSGAANWLAKNYGRKTNPRKKTVSQKISQLEHEGYPHKQSIAIALSEQRRGKVKRNPSGEIGAYEITRNFKVLGIFKTKADAIKAAQGISDATGKTIAVKPVQVLAGHFDR